MTSTSSARPAIRILVIGVGDLTIRLTHLLSSSLEPTFDIFLTSRSGEKSVRFANLASFASHNLGANSTVTPLTLDPIDKEAVEKILSDVKPDLIFVGASMQAARLIMDLPPDSFRELDRAQLGPWLPVHLCLVMSIMRAVRDTSSSEVKVINAAYPDAVGPALKGAGLAPHIGIGNIGNIWPGMKYAVAAAADLHPAAINLKVVAHHFFSHHVHRFGEATGIPHFLEARDHFGQPVGIDESTVFSSLSRGLRRQGGLLGQQLTATSAFRTILAMVSHSDVEVHAPAPGGLVGGYPLTVSRDRIALNLPKSLDRKTALALNEECQILDGISRIEPDGKVHFEARHMGIMFDKLGYRTPSLTLDEMRPAALDLRRRFEQYASRTVGL